MTTQNEVEEKKVLELIVAASEEFLQSTGNEINYQKLTDTILYISGAKYAGFDLYEEDGIKFRTVALSAPAVMIKNAASLLGFKLPGKVWDADPVRDGKLKFSTITHFSSLLELAGDVIPKPVVSLLEKTFRIGEVILVKILKENIIIGNFTLVMPENVSLKNESYIELYTRQVGLLITRSRSENALQKSEEKFSMAFHSGTILMAISTVQEGLYIDVNDAFLKVLGFKREEVIGRKSSDLNIFAIKEQREIIKERFLSEGRVSNAEVQIKGQDGLVHTGIFTADPINVGGTLCWLTTMTDITDRKKTEDALRESEEKFRDLAQLLPEVVFEMNLQGTLTFVNQQAFKIFGYTRQDFDRGINAVDMLIAEDKDKALRAMQLIIQGGSTGPNEYTALKIDGSTFPILISSVAVIREGRAAGLRGLIFDITERKTAEDLIRRERERLTNIIEGTNVGTWEWNVQTGETLFNERWGEIVGYTLEELAYLSVGSWEKFAHPEDLKKAREQLNKVFSREINYYDAEMRIKRKDGSWIWIQDRGKVVSWTDDGKPLWMNGTYIDITERKRVEEKLKESQAILMAAFENSQAGIAIAEAPDGKLRYVNNAGLLIRDKSERELVENISIDQYVSSWNILHLDGTPYKPEDVPLSKAVMHGKTSSEEFIIRRDNTEDRIVWANAGPILDETGEIKAGVVVFLDITERKKAEEEILHLSFHDHLTGLYNRRFFEEELKRLDTERQLPLSFIMGDLNSLKIINDVFGHDEGDKLLKEVAEIMKSVCRSDDILARWGGDEFVILLPKTSAADTEDIVERIKNECGKTNSRKIPASLSLGAATKEKVSQDIQSIVIDAEGNMYKNKLAQKESLTSSIIFALEQALYEKSSETKEHTDRMHDFALKLGKSARLSSHQLDELSLLASLHDIGKVAIPEKILLKKGKLTEKEWSTIKRHPEIGFNIAQSSPQIAHIAKSILSCHENFDGSGYPMGLKGHAIPAISRIILIVDAYDVMTSGRAYKPAMSKEDAIKELKRCAGTQFDPELVDKFIEIISKK